MSEFKPGNQFVQQDVAQRFGHIFATEQNQNFNNMNEEGKHQNNNNNYINLQQPPQNNYNNNLNSQSYYQANPIVFENEQIIQQQEP